MILMIVCSKMFEYTSDKLFIIARILLIGWLLIWRHINTITKQVEHEPHHSCKSIVLAEQELFDYHVKLVMPLLQMSLLGLLTLLCGLAIKLGNNLSLIPTDAAEAIKKRGLKKKTPLLFRRVQSNSMMAM